MFTSTGTASIPMHCPLNVHPCMYVHTYAHANTDTHTHTDMTDRHTHKTI